MEETRKVPPTPGPWTAFYEEGSVPERSCWIVRASAGTPVFVGPCVARFDRSFSEAEANARLIAVAPDLYAAGAALLAKLDAIVHHPKYQAAFATSQAHRGPYLGPNWVDEARALSVVIARAGGAE